MVGGLVMASPKLVRGEPDNPASNMPVMYLLEVLNVSPTGQNIQSDP